MLPSRLRHLNFLARKNKSTPIRKQQLSAIPTMAPVDSVEEDGDCGEDIGEGGPGLKLSVHVQLSVSMMASCGAAKSLTPGDVVVYPNE